LDEGSALLAKMLGRRAVKTINGRKGVGTTANGSSNLINCRLCIH
jgi:hypothetical protein